jgi:hypothetical protein
MKMLELDAKPSGDANHSSICGRSALVAATKIASSRSVHLLFRSEPTAQPGVSSGRSVTPTAVIPVTDGPPSFQQKSQRVLLLFPFIYGKMENTLKEERKEVPRRK